jgi:hypothetical protein
LSKFGPNERSEGAGDAGVGSMSQKGRGAARRGIAGVSAAARIIMTTEADKTSLLKSADLYRT